MTMLGAESAARREVESACRVSNQSDPDGDTQQPQVSVVVPAYNEQEGLAPQVAAIRAALEPTDYEYEIIVVDDGSNDETAARAQELDGVVVVRHPVNKGYGAALKTGIRKAKGEYVVIIDADGTYPAAAIPELLVELENSDMVVGARTGEEVKVPLLRRPAKWLLRRLAEFLSETKIPDLNSGLRAFRRADVVPYLPMLCSGFSFTTTITLAMLCTERIVSYVPINYHARVGRSKIRPLKDTYNFLLLILRTICYFNPLKVFMPPALLLGAIGLVKLVVDLVFEGNVYDSELLALGAALQLGALGLIADAVAAARLRPDEEHR